VTGRAVAGLVALLAGCGHDLLRVRSGDAVLPVQVKGDVDRGTLVLFESGGPSGPGIAERRVGSMDWAPFVEAEVAVAFYDRRGVGNADGDYAPDDQSFDVLLDDLDAVLATLRAAYGFDRVVLFGHSFGTQVALAHGARSPGDVDAIALVGPAPFEGDHLFVPYRRDFACRVADEQATVDPDEPLWAEIQTWCADTPVVDVSDLDHRSDDWVTLGGYLDEIADRLGAQGPMDVGGLLATVFGSHYGVIDTMMRDNLISSHIGFEGFDLFPELGALTAPVLVVTGEYDDVTPTELAVAVAGAVGTPADDVRTLEMPDVGHYAWDREPEVFADALLDLVDRAEGG
jgi:pimeloyl-ACP methyl ester carboxylesterase